MNPQDRFEKPYDRHVERVARIALRRAKEAGTAAGSVYALLSHTLEALEACAYIYEISDIATVAHHAFEAVKKRAHEYLNPTQGEQAKTQDELSEMRYTYYACGTYAYYDAESGTHYNEAGDALRDPAEYDVHSEGYTPFGDE